MIATLFVGVLFAVPNASAPCAGEVAVDGFGVTHRVFSQNQSGNWEVFYENDRGQPPCTFNATTNVSNDTTPSLSPQITAVPGTSLVYVTWYANVSGARILTYTMTDDNGTSWLLPKGIRVLPSELTTWDLSYWGEFLNVTVDGSLYDYITVPFDVYRNLYRVALRNYSFDTRVGEPPLPPNLKIMSYPPGTDGYYLVQVRGTMEQAWIDRAVELGAAPFDFVPYSSIIMRLTDSERTALSSESFVKWTGIYQPAYKISPELDSAAGVVNLTVLAFKGEDVTVIANAITSLGGTILFQGDTGLDGIILCQINASKIPDIAILYGVFAIGSTPTVAVHNDQARLVIQSGGTTSPFHDAGIRGQGQRVAIADTGLDLFHPAFADPEGDGAGPNHRKVFAYFVPAGGTGNDQPDSTCSDHGTHVGGSIGADAPVHGAYTGPPNRDGQSFQSLLIVQDISNAACSFTLSPPAIYANMFNPDIQNGAFIHSNSWGRGGNRYSAFSRQVDDFMFNNPDFLILWSAGNGGPGAMTIGQEANAKNIITVGASGNGALANNMAQGNGGGYFSSRGPAGDGRFKPTVIAPGQDVLSADSQTNVDISFDGTSMAAPTTAGAAALIRQYFMDGWYPGGSPNSANALVPSSALVKAVLIAGTQEITGTHAYHNNENYYPNNQQGWGRVHLDRSLFLGGQLRRLAIFDETRGLLTNEYEEFDFQVTSNLEEVRVVLTWTDAPGLADTCGMDAQCLRNNLDLRVTKLSDNRILRGNVFNRPPQGSPPGHGSIEGGAFDTRNVEEAVMLFPEQTTLLQPGTYRIRVTGTQVPQGPQRFALAVTGRVTDFRPVGYHTIRGFLPFPTGTDVSFDGGVSWGFIDGDGLPDALFMTVLNNAVGSESYSYRIGWDFDGRRGNFAAFTANSAPVLACSNNQNLCANVQGGGAELLHVDGDGIIDAIFMVIDSPDGFENFFRYRVFYDLDATGVFTGGSTPELGAFRVGSWNNEGGGLACDSIGGGGALDCVFMAVDDPGFWFDNQYRYIVGFDIGTNGGFTSVTNTKGFVGVGWPYGRGGGFDLTNVDGDATLDGIFMMVTYDANFGFPSWFQYRIGFDINANGDFASGYSVTKSSPFTFGIREAQGGGVAADWLDGYFRRDVMFMAVPSIPSAPNEYRFRVAYNIDTQGNFV